MLNYMEHLARLRWRWIAERSAHKIRHCGTGSQNHIRQGQWSKPIQPEPQNGMAACDLGDSSREQRRVNPPCGPNPKLLVFRDVEDFTYLGRHVVRTRAPPLPAASYQTRRIS